MDNIGFGTNAAKPMSPKANRRAPDRNISNEQSPPASTDMKAIESSNDNKDPYQNYKNNDKPKKLDKAEATKRYPIANTKQLNNFMDKTASATRDKALPTKPVEVNARTNLKEVVDYNKKRKSIPSQEPEISISKPSDSKSIVTIKPPAQLQTPPKSSEAPRKTKSTKASKTVTSPKETKVKQTKTAPQQVAAKPLEIKSPPVAVKPKIEEKKPLPPAAVVIPVASIATPAPVTKPIEIKTSPADLPTIGVVAPQAVATLPMPAVPQVKQQAKNDNRNIEHDEFKKSLKDKYINNQPKGYLDSEADANLPTVDVVEENQTEQKPIPAVSNMLSSKSDSKLDKVNILLISYYFKTKNIIASWFNSEE